LAAGENAVPIEEKSSPENHAKQITTR